MFNVSLLLIFFLIPFSLFAQQLPRLGEPMTAEETAYWDRFNDIDGSNLPVGRGNVRQGEILYRQQCIACHGVNGIVNAPLVPLAGGHGSLLTDKPVRTIGSYWPYATTVFDYIRRAMPYTAQKSLSTDEVYGLTAYLLYLNNIIEQDDEINNENLPGINMPNRNGFIPAH